MSLIASLSRQCDCDHRGRSRWIGSPNEAAIENVRSNSQRKALCYVARESDRTAERHFPGGTELPRGRTRLH